MESNEQLLVRAGQGDRIVFAKLYDRTAPSVAGAACWFSADAEQIETLMLATYLGTWMSAPHYTAPQGHAKAWILTLAWKHAPSQALLAIAG